MKIGRLLVAVPLALIAGQAQAVNWVKIGTTGQSIDKDSIQRGSDGLVHFTSYSDAFHVKDSDAADCQQRLIYFGDDPGWRDRGRRVAPNSFAEAELNLVCANAG